MELTIHGVVLISVLTCFLLAGVIVLFLYKPERVPERSTEEEDWKTCECCGREKTHQRLENLKTGVMHPFYFTCSGRRKFDSEEYQLHLVHGESLSDLPDSRSYDTRKTEYSQQFSSC